MKRKGRLGTVLRMRSIAERDARIAVARADRAVADAAQARDEQAQAPKPRPPGDVLSPVQLRALALQGVRSHELLQAAVQEVERCVEARRTAAHAWSQAQVQRRSTERLVERRDATAAAEASQAAERALDELVVLRRGWQR